MLPVPRRLTPMSPATENLMDVFPSSDGSRTRGSTWGAPSAGGVAKRPAERRRLPSCLPGVRQPAAAGSGRGARRPPPSHGDVAAGHSPPPRRVFLCYFSQTKSTCTPLCILGECRLTSFVKSHMERRPTGAPGAGTPPGRRRRRVCRPCLGGLKVRTHCSKNQHEKVRYSLGGGGGRCLPVVPARALFGEAVGSELRDRWSKPAFHPVCISPMVRKSRFYW